MNSDFSIFASSIDQVRVLDHLVSQLKLVKDKLLENKEGKITEKIPEMPRSIASIFSFLEQKGYEPTGSAAQREYVSEVISYLNKLPITKLKLAFEPNETFIRNISQVITNLVGQKVILDITADPKIVAGVQIEYKGKFIDLSQQKKTETYIEEKLPKFLSTKLVEEES